MHTRIDEAIEFITARAHAGNQYVNRNIVGAVVGVQPFGGEGLSGTGPKAGGPLLLHRLLARGPHVDIAAARAPLGIGLPGPTGESNTYRLLPREAVLCLADEADDLRWQIDTVHAAGCRAVCIDSPATRRIAESLPDKTRSALLWANRCAQRSLQPGLRPRHA